MQLILRAVLVTLVAFSAFGQVSETIEVSIVNVDVVVTNRKGENVTGLTAADFEVLANGMVQPITNFSEYTTATTRAESGTAAAPAPSAAPETAPPVHERRTIVFFLEKSPMLPQHTKQFFANLKQTLRAVVRPGDAVAIADWTYVMNVRADFTDDITKLEKTLDAIAAEYATVGLDANSDYLRNLGVQAMLDAATAEQGSEPVSPLTLDGREAARMALVAMRRKVAALKTLVGTMGGIEGRRILVMNTHRFSQYAGAEFFGGDVPQQYRDEFDTRALRDSLAEVANAAGVTVYTSYAPGIGKTGVPSVEEGPRLNIRSMSRDRDLKSASRNELMLINETAAISELAKATGGVAMWGPSDWIRLPQTLRRDLESYYSIAFRTPATPSGRSRVSVRMKNPAYSARVRTEHVQKDDTMQMRERVVAALYQPRLEVRLPFDVKTGEVSRVHGDRFRIPLRIRVAPSVLTSLDGQRSFRIFGVTGGRMGVLSDVFEKTQTSRSATDGIEYELEIVVDRGADRIVIGLFDDISRQWGLARVSLVRPPR
jgi:VWFA-related protein